MTDNSLKNLSPLLINFPYTLCIDFIPYQNILINSDSHSTTIKINKIFLFC